ADRPRTRCAPRRDTGRRAAPPNPDARDEPDGSRLVHEATPDGLGIADERLEPGGVDVDDSRSAILDPRRDGQSRLQQCMAGGSDVLLDVRPGHEGWTAGGGF